MLRSLYKCYSVMTLCLIMLLVVVLRTCDGASIRREAPRSSSTVALRFMVIGEYTLRSHVIIKVSYF